MMVKVKILNILTIYYGPYIKYINILQIWSIWLISPWSFSIWTIDPKNLDHWSNSCGWWCTTKDRANCGKPNYKASSIASNGCGITFTTKETKPIVQQGMCSLISSIYSYIGMWGPEKLSRYIPFFPPVYHFQTQFSDQIARDKMG